MRFISRIDVLRLIPGCLCDSFVIVLDDVNGFPESVMLNKLKQKLDLYGCQSKAILTPNVQRWRDTSKLQSTF